MANHLDNEDDGKLAEPIVEEPVVVEDAIDSPEKITDPIVIYQENEPWLSSLIELAAFQNAFWVFVGILAGAIIQFLLHQAIRWQQRFHARRLFRVEIAINMTELENLAADMQRRKEIFTAGEQVDIDFLFDMSGFNYRMLDPLINSGYFHDLLGIEGVSRYFRFANDANTDAAGRWTRMLQQRFDEGAPVRFLDYLLTNKIPEMRDNLEFVERQLK